jgi:SsrA-binding protein
MSATEQPIKIIGRNRKAFRDYTIDERFEAGIMLVGSEVKTLRGGRVTLAGAHLRITRHEAFAMGIDIPEYAGANQFNHEVDRPRKLLLHKRQIEKLERELRQRGTAAPILSIYFKGKNVKVEIGLARGRRKTDKRDVIKERDAKRDMGRALRGKQ